MIECRTVLVFALIPLISTGNGDYSYDDDDRSWPEEPKIWYLNFFLSTVTGNVIFALFTEGIMKVCDKLQNPMSEEDTSFPEFAYGKLPIVCDDVMYR